MTGRIKLIGSETNDLLSEINTPEIPYAYDCVSSFDESCGTFDVDRFQTSDNPQCPKSFVCDEAGIVGEMKGCIDAMNCAMLTGMTIYYGDEGKDSKVNDVILFLREMIPHHQNAVNMAKYLLKSGEVECDGSDEESVPCVLDPIIRGIINTQNHQIQVMDGLLEAFDVAGPEEKICVAKKDDESAAAPAKFSFAVFFALLLAGMVV